MSVGYEFSLYSATIIMFKMQAVCLFGSVLITDRVRDALYIIQCIEISKTSVFHSGFIVAFGIRMFSTHDCDLLI